MSTNLHPEVIFFDYGNTLCADSDDRFGDIRRYLAGHGIDLGAKAFAVGWDAAEAYAGSYRVVHGRRTRKRDRFWYHFCRAFLVSAIGDEAGELAEEMHATQFFTNTIYPDTISTLTELRARGYRLGVISNWDAPTLAAQFDRFGMAPFFEHILPSFEAEADKPDPHIFHTAMAALDAAPERAIHVGDSWGCDVEGARAVGITPVWVNEEGAPAPDGSDVLEIRTRADLLEIVE